MRKRLLTVLVPAVVGCLVTALPAAAQGEEEVTPSQYAFIVETNDGVTVSYTLDKEPVLSHDGENFVLQTSESTVYYSPAEVAHFRLAKVEKPETGLDETLAEESATWSYTGETLAFRGATPGDTVLVYSTDGRQVLSGTVGNDGSALVSVSSLTPGVYVITLSNHSYKIVKK